MEGWLLPRQLWTSGVDVVNDESKRAGPQDVTKTAAGGVMYGACPGVSGSLSGSLVG